MTSLEEMGKNFCKSVGRFKHKEDLKKCSMWFVKQWKKAVSGDGKEE